MHLAPKLFFPKKIVHALVIIYSKKILILSNPRFFMPRWSTENRAEIAAILAHKGKGLVTTVTSLREHDNLYFASFRTVYLFYIDIGRK